MTNDVNGKGDLLVRSAPEGHVPLISVEGSAYDCGKEYAQIVMEKYPGYRRYLDIAWTWRTRRSLDKKLIESRAPYLNDVYSGITDEAGPPRPESSSQSQPGAETTQSACTSFGVSGSATFEGQPISGQNKDTVVSSALLYIVLRMRIKDGPSILVLAYPGELLGYGFWNTGTSVFRNSLYSTAGGEDGLDNTIWALVALAGTSVEEAAELACRHRLRGAGNYLISDSQGQSVSVEYNAGGTNTLSAKDNIATHANHPEGKDTASARRIPSEEIIKDSQNRMHHLWDLLNTHRNRLSAQRAMMLLSDHTYYPRGICRHSGERKYTTASVVAEPTRGLLHVVRGHPCVNWPKTYSA